MLVLLVWRNITVNASPAAKVEFLNSPQSTNGRNITRRMATGADEPRKKRSPISAGRGAAGPKIRCRAQRERERRAAAICRWRRAGATSGAARGSDVARASAGALTAARPPLACGARVVNLAPHHVPHVARALNRLEPVDEELLAPRRSGHQHILVAAAVQISEAGVGRVVVRHRTVGEAHKLGVKGLVRVRASVRARVRARGQGSRLTHSLRSTER